MSTDQRDQRDQRDYKRVLTSLLPRHRIGDTVRYLVPEKFVPDTPVYLASDGYPRSPPVHYEHWIITGQDELYFYLERNSSSHI